jgi:hypothetical protein
MFVKLKTGARAGEVVEMKFADAQPLLEDGRAERVNYEQIAATVMVEAPPSKQPKPKPKGKNKS